MKKIEGYINILKGSLIMKDKQKFFEAVRSLPDGLYTLCVEFVYDNRTSPQNRYYWGVVVKAYVQGALDEWGEVISSLDAHEQLKVLCNYEERVNKETGVIINVPKSTAKLKTVPFWDYVERCRRHIQEWFGIKTPDPEKNKNEKKS